MPVLVVNAGSRSVKLRLVGDADEIVAGTDLGPPDDDVLSHLEDFMSKAGSIDAVGHRVVHGGTRFTQPTVMSEDVRRDLEGLNDLAPLHNPPALAGIDAARRLLPDVPSVACFDTAFHAGLPPASSTYAIPSDWVSRWGIRRYGFHGLSCAWAVRRAATMLAATIPPETILPETILPETILPETILPETILPATMLPATTSPLRVIVCHLGGGASVTAVSGGRSVDTTMGFTPLEGLVMATRSGDLDPGALIWALQHGLSADAALDDLERKAGLLGLSGGRSSDTRVLLEARALGDEAAALAVSVYVHRLRAKVAAMAAATGGTDALVFTGGVGENSAVIRSETCRDLSWMGVALDEGANAATHQADADVSAAGASVRTMVVQAREELEIAWQCRRLLDQDRPGRRPQTW
jgi:acetate kinase